MNYTYLEINNQPLSWKKTLKVTNQEWMKFESDLDINKDTQFIFIGCGTSYYLAQSAAALFQELTEHVSRAVPASEVFLTSQSVISKNIPTVVFAISRSGTTSEVLLAVKYLQSNFRNVKIVGVTCHTESTLTNILPYTISLDHAAEKSVVMTQSFTNMLLALQLIATRIAKRDDMITELSELPLLLETQKSKFEEFGKNMGYDHNRKYYVFLGMGKYFGLAEEATLKLKEMTQTPCEAYNPLEFRHGPISMITAESCAVVIQGQEAEQYISEVSSDIAKYGALVATLHPSNAMRPKEDGTSFVELQLEGHISDWARTILYMPPLQFLAYFKAVSLGLNPDEPRNLTQVVVLNNV